MSESMNDNITLFRQSATALTAGVFLISICTSITVFIGGWLLFLATLVFLAAGIFQLLHWFDKCVNTIRKWGDTLTIFFIMISTLSIITRFSDIKTNNLSDNLTLPFTIPCINCSDTLVMQFNFSWLIPAVLLYWSGLGVYLIFEIIGMYGGLGKKYGTKQMLIILVLALALIAGIYGTAYFGNITSDCSCILLIISISWTIGIILVLSRYYTHLRRLNMESKDKARENAVTVSSLAKLISDLLYCSPLRRGLN